MKLKLFLYALIMLAMSLAVPWGFSPEQPAPKPGSLPDWVVYAIGAAVAYAALVATCLQFFWDTSANGADGNEKEDRAGGPKSEP